MVGVTQDSPAPSAIPFDADIVRKYSRPGPRYTSYPTAPHFHEGIGVEDLDAEIELSNRTEPAPDLSLYFHLPFCEKLCYFCACSMMITHRRTTIDGYIDYLKREIDMMCSHLSLSTSTGKRHNGGGERKVVQLHWGGGTPTYLSPEQIVHLFGHIQSQFSFHEDAEIGVEIDPRGLTSEHLETLREVGFNRVSMGQQDFDEKVQKTVNRIQPEELTRWVIGECRRLGFSSINIDLIYGLPFQTRETFEQTIDIIIDIDPDRIAAFNYAHVPWLKKHQNLLKDEWLPPAEEKLAILEMLIGRLTEAGYHYIGMDHFAKPDDELTIAQKKKSLHRNFQGYSTKAGCDLHAMGMTGVSSVGGLYVQNEKTLPDYYAALDAGRLPIIRGYRLSEDDTIRRHVITRIMCDLELTKGKVEERFGISFDDYFADSLEELKGFAEDDLISFTDGRIVVEPLGRLLIRNIGMVFDAHLERPDRKGPRYSMTV